MDEIEKEYQDSLNPDEGGELNTTDAEPTGEEGSDEPLSEEQIKAIVEENKKLKAINPKLKMEFRIKHKDIDEEQLEYISAFAKGKGVSLDEAFEDKLVQKLIEEDMREKKVANAIPSGKSQSPEYQDLQAKLSQATTKEEHKKLWKEFQEQSKSKGVQTE